MFWPVSISVIMLFIIGIYCVVATHNLIRVLIGLELLIKAVTLLFIAVGFIGSHEAIAQALVVTMIVVEAVVMTIAMGVVFGIRSHNNSLDVRKIRQLKG
jgi:multisubunit Na+/H+ antiporter MnhC subunit